MFRSHSAKKRRRADPDRRLRPGRASSFIRHASVEIQPGDRVVICCRVSRRSQDHRGNLDNSEAHLRDVAAKLGATVVDSVRHVGSGFDPAWLARASAIAIAHGAKLLAETTDRFIRSEGYHSRRAPDDQARESDLQHLVLFTDGVALVTDLHPDASPTQVRGYQARRGQSQKGNRGGRPPKSSPGDKKRRRELLRPEARKLRSQGRSLRQIAQELGIRHTTIAHWVRGVPFFPTPPS